MKSEQNNSADTKVSEEGGGGGALGTRVEIPLQPTETTTVRQVLPLQPMEDLSGADIHLQLMEDPRPEHVGMPPKKLQPMESPHRSKLLAGPVAGGETPHKVFWQ
ncbi:hypothetical protein llap_1995 [Limosa lapponica baueri]|uniref:Protein pxr1-like n=1 Tax=Limosa lapponica baueri TaxID=1758121 RepID=A0A2I0UNT5_LIMLA|nr:hypothetical protein llap_1995 [Limosa lapponica baueri]